MSELTKIFNYQEKQVRTVVKDGQPWFVAKDVCDVLEIQNTTDALKRLESDEVTRFNLGGLSGETNIINEYGLYSLVLGSRKPDAKQFKRWITHDVIPSIRKHGVYMTPEAIEKVLLSPDTIIQIATQLKEEQQKRLEAERQIEDQKSMVLFAETCIASNDSLLIREVAKLANKKGVSIGEKKLWTKLREWGVVSKQNEPYQHAMNAGWFEIRQGAYSTPYGSETYRTTKVLPKGQVYIIERLKKEFDLAI